MHLRCFLHTVNAYLSEELLVEVISVGLNAVTLKTAGILEEYAADQDKKEAEYQAKFDSNK